MRNILILALFLLVASQKAYPQALHIYHNHNDKADVYPNALIDSIRIKELGNDKERYEFVLYTNEGVIHYDEANVDSILFNMPHLKSTTHRLQIPFDKGILKFAVYYSGTDNFPVVKIPNGEEIELLHAEGLGYGLPCNGEYEVYINEGSSLYKDEPKTELWHITNGVLNDSITVEYTGKTAFGNKFSDFAVSSEAVDYKLITQLDGLKLNIPEDWLDWRFDEDGNIMLSFSKNETENKRSISLNPYTDNYSIHYQFPLSGKIDQVSKFNHTSEEHMNALRDFYEATNMKDLGINWFSDKPLWEWDCNINSYEDQWIDYSYIWYVKDHVVNMTPGGVGLKGTLPASFEILIDDIAGNGEINLTFNALRGTIPANIKSNPNWANFGWNIIQQDTWTDGGFDLEGNSNLFLDNSEVVDFINDKTTTVNEVLSNNTLTWVFNGGAVDLIRGISDERVNKYLDYKDKGLGLVVTVGIFSDVPYDNYKKYVLDEQEYSGLPTEILWTKGFDKADIGSYGSMSLIDKSGELIWYRLYDGGIPDSFYLEEIDAVCHRYFGDPVEHPLYVSSSYESTDYSKDGEIITLQKSTVGNGINLVLTGDMFVDKDLAEGGLFEEEVNKAMECFFSVNPYKVFRDRFNVYAVKAVSKNGSRGESHAFDNQDDKVLEYAAKIPGIDMDNVTIIVLENNAKQDLFISGYTVMLDNGASIAYIQDGGASEIIVHEAGGHGFAKLLDEYIVSGYEDNRLPEEEQAAFKDYIRSFYHDRGWGINVATTDEVDNVPWKKYLNDDRYSHEVGIYEGAWFYPHDLWRPSENSVMNNDYSTFNVPSREAIYKRIMELSEGEDWCYDYDTFVDFDQQIMQQANTISKSHESIITNTLVHKSPVFKRINGNIIEEIKFLDKDSKENEFIQSRFSKNLLINESNESDNTHQKLPEIVNNGRDRRIITNGICY